MSLQRNFYEVLGIPPGATTDQIKKKYRELARKYHPDVVQDKALGLKVFSQINQAYRVLVDPERRAQYNSTLQPARPVPAAPPRPAPTPAAPTPAARPATPTAATTSTARPAAPVTPQPAPVPPAAAKPAASPSATTTRMLANADNALMQGKFAEARGYCIKILESEPGNAKAQEILGDALMHMGHRDEAAVQYRRALQSSPSAMVQAKLNRIEQVATPTRTHRPDTEPEKAPSGLLGRMFGRK